MRFLVVGGSGLLGRNVLEKVVDSPHEAVGTYHTSDGFGSASIHLDRTDENEVQDVVESVDPDAVVDAAAYLDVDGCETNPRRAWEVNAEGTGYVAEAAADADAHYQYISTSYVFDGDDAPYDSTAPVSPANYYGETKYAGERAARIADDWAVVRTDVLYGLANPNFATWALGELRKGEEIDIVDDQVSTPTYAPDVASVCVRAAEQGLGGTFHAGGPESCSRYEFTMRMADVYGFDGDLIKPIPTPELGQTAPRPTDSSLDSSTLYETVDVAFHTPREAFTAMRND